MPQLPQFLRCIEGFKAPSKTYVGFYCDTIAVALSSSVGSSQFECDVLARQHSLLKQVYTQSLPFLSHAKVLELSTNFRLGAKLQDCMLWLEILRLFNEMQTLCVWDEELGDLTGERERVAEVLPKLHTLMFRSFYQALIS
jgi:hypothetical protein